MIPFRKLIFCVALSLLAACSDSAPRETWSGAMVLALSWQPGFCETRPKLRECRSQKKGRYDTTHFSLHGLWPQPGNNVYCGVEQSVVQRDKRRRWRQLDGLGLSDTIKQNLFRIMPGSRSYLHRHEWIKHGTCYSASPEVYYADSLKLMDVINSSDVQKFFAENIGREVTNKEIRNLFDSTFGNGVGNRVRVACKRDGRRTIITELTLGLKGAVSDNPDVKTLALASPITKRGCPKGLIDPVGFQ